MGVASLGLRLTTPHNRSARYGCRKAATAPASLPRAGKHHSVHRPPTVELEQTLGDQGVVALLFLADPVVIGVLTLARRVPPLALISAAAGAVGPEILEFLRPRRR